MNIKRVLLIVLTVLAFSLVSLGVLAVTGGAAGGALAPGQSARIIAAPDILIAAAKLGIAAGQG